MKKTSKLFAMVFGLSVSTLASAAINEVGLKELDALAKPFDSKMAKLEITKSKPTYYDFGSKDVAIPVQQNCLDFLKSARGDLQAVLYYSKSQNDIQSQESMNNMETNFLNLRVSNCFPKDMDGIYPQFEKFQAKYNEVSAKR